MDLGTELIGRKIEWSYLSSAVEVCTEWLEIFGGREKDGEGDTEEERVGEGKEMEPERTLIPGSRNSSVCLEW